MSRAENSPKQNNSNEFFDFQQTRDNGLYKYVHTLFRNALKTEKSKPINAHSMNYLTS